MAHTAISVPERKQTSSLFAFIAVALSLLGILLIMNAMQPHGPDISKLATWVSASNDAPVLEV